MLFRWLVYPHFCWLTPAADGTAPARWIGLAGGLVDLGSLLANCRGGSTGAAVVVVWVPIGLCPHVRLHIGAIALGIAIDIDLSLSLHSTD